MVNKGDKSQQPGPDQKPTTPDAQQSGPVEQKKGSKLFGKVILGIGTVCALITSIIIFFILFIVIGGNSTPLKGPLRGPLTKEPLTSDSEIPTDTTPSATPTARGIHGPCPVTSGYLTAKPSSQNGRCELSFPLTHNNVIGYSLLYPSGWSVKTVGAADTNILFNARVSSSKEYEIFILLAPTTFPLVQADKVAYSYEQSNPDPLVDPNEQVKTREIKTIGDKEVLALFTSKDENYIARYFFARKDEKYEHNSLYMFETVIPPADVGSDDYQKLINSIEEMIASMNFVR